MYSAIRFLPILAAAARAELPLAPLLFGRALQPVDQHRYPSAILGDA
jgi:hypothetical protein